MHDEEINGSIEENKKNRSSLMVTKDIPFSALKQSKISEEQE
jgi:hypothetical protein